MIGWRFEEALEVDTHQAVTRWWAYRGSCPAAPVPDGLVQDLQAARVALDEGLQRRFFELAGFLTERERRICQMRIAGLDPGRVLSQMAVARKARGRAAERQGNDHQEMIAALKERAYRREKLRRPSFRSATRRRLRDFAHGRGRLAAVLKDDDACRMLRFGALLCDLIEVDAMEEAEPGLDAVRRTLVGLAEADARRAAGAVLNDPLVGLDDRGRPLEAEITEFVAGVIGAVKRRAGWQITSTITRAAARSPNLDDLPGPDVQLILDLLACHAPCKTAEAVALLIKRP